MKGHSRRVPPTAPRPAAGPRALSPLSTLSDGGADSRPFWQDLMLATLPAVAGAFVSGVCSLVGEALAHRREREHGAREAREAHGKRKMN